MNFFKKTLLCSAFCLSDMVAFSAFAQIAPEIPSKIVFSRELKFGQAVDRVKETYSWGTQTLPAHRIAKPGSGFLHYTFGTLQPAGTSTQYLKFRFKSTNLFTANPNSHFFVMARAETTSWYLRGRGFIVGDLNNTPNPCYTASGGMTSQPETWFSVPNTVSSGNYVWNNTSNGTPYCGQQLANSVWYDAELHVNNSNHFYYRISQNGNTVGGGRAILDNINPEGYLINGKLTGFAFGLTQPSNYSSPWNLEFDYIQMGWF